MLPYFIFNDVDSRSLGVWVSKLPDIIRPNERVQSVAVYGRSGSLHVREGTNVFDSYEKTISLIVRPEADVGTVLNLYRGEGEVVFSNEPNRLYTVYVSKQLSLARDGNWLLKGDLTFEVQPFKRDSARPAVQTLTASGDVFNLGDVECYPELTVVGHGVMSIVIGSDTFVIDASSSQTDQTYIMNCLNETCTLNGMNANPKCSGNYPHFEVGNNTVTITNATSVSFRPDWLYL